LNRKKFVFLLIAIAVVITGIFLFNKQSNKVNIKNYEPLVPIPKNVNIFAYVTGQEIVQPVRNLLGLNPDVPLKRAGIYISKQGNIFYYVELPQNINVNKSVHNLWIIHHSLAEGIDNSYTVRTDFGAWYIQADDNILLISPVKGITWQFARINKGEILGKKVQIISTETATDFSVVLLAEKIPLKNVATGAWISEEQTFLVPVASMTLSNNGYIIGGPYFAKFIQGFLDLTVEDVKNIVISWNMSPQTPNAIFNGAINLEDIIMQQNMGHFAIGIDGKWKEGNWTGILTATNPVQLSEDVALQYAEKQGLKYVLLQWKTGGIKWKEINCSAQSVCGNFSIGRPYAQFPIYINVILSRDGGLAMKLYGKKIRKP